MRASCVQPVTDGRARRFVLGLIACAFLFLACLVPIPYAATTVRVGTYTNEPLVFRDSQGVYRTEADRNVLTMEKRLKAPDRA